MPRDPRFSFYALTRDFLHLVQPSCLWKTGPGKPWKRSFEDRALPLVIFVRFASAGSVDVGLRQTSTGGSALPRILYSRRAGRTNELSHADGRVAMPFRQNCFPSLIQSSTAAGGSLANHGCGV